MDTTRNNKYNNFFLRICMEKAAFLRLLGLLFNFKCSKPVTCKQAFQKIGAEHLSAGIFSLSDRNRLIICQFFIKIIC